MDEAKISRLVGEGKIRIKMIIEIAGTPEKHINKTLKEITDNVEGEKAITPIKTKRRKAKDIGEGVFSAFAEMEFLISRISDIFGVIYDYLPSSVEIIEPDELTDTTANISEVINDLTAKLHQYNTAFNQLTAKNVMMQRDLASGDSKPSTK